MKRLILLLFPLLFLFLSCSMDSGGTGTIYLLTMAMTYDVLPGANQLQYTIKDQQAIIREFEYLAEKTGRKLIEKNYSESGGKGSIETKIQNGFTATVEYQERQWSGTELLDDFLKAKLGADDLLVFFYSGHGIDGALASETLGKDSAAVCYLQAEEILDNMEAISGGTKLILADACYSGLLLEDTNTSTRMDLFSDVLKQKGSQIYHLVQFEKEDVLGSLEKAVSTCFSSSKSNNQLWALTACTSKQLSGEFSDLEHGLFTYTLLEAMGYDMTRELPKLKQERISVFSLYQAIVDHMGTYLATQTPQTTLYPADLVLFNP